MKAWIIAFILISQANAVELFEETDWGSSTFSQTVNGYGEFGGDEAKDIDAPWNLSGNYNYYTTKDTSEATEIVDKTNSYTVNGGWDGGGPSVNLKALFTNTPDEQLTSRGAAVIPSYSWKYLGESKGFSPYLLSKLTLGTVNYDQAARRTVRRKGAAATKATTAELRQNQVGISLSWKPMRQWRFGVGVDGYSYNKDVAQFESRLDSRSALSHMAAGFANTVGGLPKVSYSAGIDWRITKALNSSLRETYSIMAADDSVSTTTREVLEYTLTQAWRLSGGVEFDHSDSITDTLAIAGLEWDSD